MLFAGCCSKSDKRDYSYIRVCPLGSQTVENCVEYNVDYYDYYDNTDYLLIKTNKGKIKYNTNGWEILIQDR